MRSSVIYGVIAALITLVAMYLDQRLFDAQKTKATYIKNMVFVGLLVGGGIYLIGETAFDQALAGLQQTGRGGSSAYGAGGFGFIGGIGEEILTGSPNF
jgi:hypothetical protein